jgi:hypothetical protein
MAAKVQRHGTKNMRYNEPVYWLRNHGSTPIFLYGEVLNKILNWTISNGTLTPQFLPYPTPKDNILPGLDLDILVYWTTAIAPSSPSIIVFTFISKKTLFSHDIWLLEIWLPQIWKFVQSISHGFSMQFVLHMVGLPYNFHQTPKFYLLPPHWKGISEWYILRGNCINDF